MTLGLRGESRTAPQLDYPLRRADMEGRMREMSNVIVMKHEERM